MFVSVIRNGSGNKQAPSHHELHIHFSEYSDVHIPFYGVGKYSELYTYMNYITQLTYFVTDIK